MGFILVHRSRQDSSWWRSQGSVSLSQLVLSHPQSEHRDGGELVSSLLSTFYSAQDPSPENGPAKNEVGTSHISKPNHDTTPL